MAWGLPRCTCDPAPPEIGGAEHREWCALSTPNPAHPTHRTHRPEIEWRETGVEGVHDLYVDRRLVDYDVPVDLREDALRRARLS